VCTVLRRAPDEDVGVTFEYRGFSREIVSVGGAGIPSVPGSFEISNGEGDASMGVAPRKPWPGWSVPSRLAVVGAAEVLFTEGADAITAVYPAQPRVRLGRGAPTPSVKIVVLSANAAKQYHSSSPPQ